MTRLTQTPDQIETNVDYQRCRENWGAKQVPSRPAKDGEQFVRFNRPVDRHDRTSFLSYARGDAYSIGGGLSGSPATLMIVTAVGKPFRARYSQFSQPVQFAFVREATDRERAALSSDIAAEAAKTRAVMERAQSS
jgi:hypothetical protein